MAQRKRTDKDLRDHRVNVGLDPELREAVEIIADAQQKTMSGVIYDILNDAREHMTRYARRLSASKREKENLKNKVGSEYKEILSGLDKIEKENNKLDIKTLDSEQQMYVLEIKDMSRRLKASLAKSISEKIKSIDS